MSGSGLQRPSYDDLALLVTQQAARITEQDAVITALTVEVAELRRRLGMDSSNSSKPPSSDGLDRTKRSTPGTGSGKRGKPRGAPGATKMLVDDPDEKVPCRLDTCGRCAAGLAGAKVFARQRRQVIDLPPPPKPHVTEYLVESLLCGSCGEVTCGDAPVGVAGRLAVRTRRESPDGGSPRGAVPAVRSGDTRVGGVVRHACRSGHRVVRGT